MHSTDPYRQPLAPDPDGDRFYREKVRSVVDALLASWNGQHPTIVLSGSLALGEGRVLRTDAGIMPASDIDLYLVTSEQAYASAMDDLPRLHAMLSRHTETRGLTVDLGVTSSARLAAAPVSIANRTLAEHGRVLTGSQDVLNGMRHLAGKTIPAADGCLLIQNRTVEALVPVPQFGEASMRGSFWYLHAKTVRDIGLSAIVVAGEFAPRLSDRTALVRKTWAKTELGSIIPAFPDRYEAAALRETTAMPGAHEQDDLAALRAAWIELGMMLYTIAGWEYRVLGALPNGEPGSWARAGSDSFRRRMKSWLPLATSEPGAFLRAMSRGFSATPMNGIYIAASCLMASTGLAWGSATQRTGSMIDSARAVYPFATGAAEPDALWWELRNGVCAYWNEMVLGGSRTIRKGSPQ